VAEGNKLMSEDKGKLPDWPVVESSFLGCSASFEVAECILFGAPFDSTSSFKPGSRFGPAVMRQDSQNLEIYSPYQERELAAHKVIDIGDLDLPAGNAAKSLEIIVTTCCRMLNAGKKPVMLGGEHLVTLGALKACRERWPDLAVIHLDAHADLRDDYLGERLSHATVMRRVWELVGDGGIWQLGIRSGTEQEFAFARAGHVRMHPFDVAAAGQVIAEIGSRPVYLTVDLDILDPSCFPGTGTPEAGGVNFNDLLQAVMKFGGLHIIAADLVELAPHYDLAGISTAAALKLLREILIML
jgi:agmatinase